MEDTIVCKGLYAYQFRVDISGNPTSTAEIRKFLELYNFVKYTGMFELSDKKKPHYQMCIWRETPFDTPQQQTKARNYWRGKTLKTKQPVSLTSAKKIKSLCSYVKKTENQPKMDDYFQQICNLSKEEKETVPLWETKLGHKGNKREKYKSTLKTVMHHSQEMDKMSFLKIVSNCYFQAYMRSCLHKSVYVSALYEYNYIEDSDIINHVFPFGLP